MRGEGAHDDCLRAYLGEDRRGALKQPQQDGWNQEALGRRVTPGTGKTLPEDENGGEEQAEPIDFVRLHEQTRANVNEQRRASFSHGSLSRWVHEQGPRHAGPLHIRVAGASAPPFARAGDYQKTT